MGGDSPGQTLERVLRRAGLVGAAGRPLVSFHGLRHTAASVMLARGVPLLVVSRQLGHRNPNVTAEVYAHLLHDAQLDDAMSAFTPPAQTVRGTVRELPEGPRSRFGSGFSARRRAPSQAEGRGFETRRPLLCAAVARATRPAPSGLSASRRASRRSRSSRAARRSACP